MNPPMLQPEYDDSVQIRVELDRQKIAALVALIESYDDFAVVRTLDQARGLVELMCSPDYLDEVRALLESLKSAMNLRVLDS